MTIWVVIAALALGSAVFKVAGPVIAGGRQPPAPLTRVIALLAPALIAALVVTGTFVDGDRLVLDARPAGVLVGALALWLRTPVIIALVLAALTCASVRLAAGA